MTAAGTFSSSENWQFLYQESCDCTFIRNFDYGPLFQLGLTEASRSEPKLLRSSEEIGQQWIFQTEGGGTGEGEPVKFINRLIGNTTYLGLGKSSQVPAMQTSVESAVWNVVSNAGLDVPSDWLQVGIVF